MRFEGRSSVRGTRPAWLAEASDIRLVGQEGTDETTLFFEMPQLGEAASAIYEQREFWATRPEATDTGFDLLGDVINDVAHDDADSERYDNPLLRRIEKFDHALNGTFQSLAIVGRRYSLDAPAEITHRVVETARRFTNTTPQAQAVRVSGRLDMIRASTHSFALQLADGEEVRGVADGFDVGMLTEYFRKVILVLGKAVYRPSGRLLRIDATDARLAEDDQQFFSRLPAPREVRIDRKLLLRPTPQINGVAAIFGRWPGDETDEQVEAALREMS
jgi:hypothetical protein